MAKNDLLRSELQRMQTKPRPERVGLTDEQEAMHSKLVQLRRDNPKAYQSLVRKVQAAKAPAGGGGGYAQAPAPVQSGYQYQPRPQQPKTYTVKVGDSPVTIAKQFGLNPQTLLNTNPNIKTIQAGQVLKLPVTQRPKTQQANLDLLYKNYTPPAPGQERWANNIPLPYSIAKFLMYGPQYETGGGMEWKNRGAAWLQVLRGDYGSLLVKDYFPQYYRAPKKPKK